MDEDKQSKVSRVIERYELEGFGAELEESWTAEHAHRASLRDLAEEFNKEVLRAALRSVDESPLDFEVEGTYEMLRDGSKSETTRARRRLERSGIDADEVESSFVSHQAIYTYLTDERGATLPEDKTDRVERKIESIEKIQGRLAAVTESALETYSSDGEVDHANYDVLVDVRIICPDCGSNSTVGELFRSGGCECEA